MKLIIAEKKDVATAIADALGGGKIEGAAYRVGDVAITWLWGHLLRLEDPNEHNPDLYAKWTLDSLPMKWPVKHLPIDQHKDHLAKVVSLIQSSDELVNAGDPDPEGQLLVDEVLEYAGATAPTQRLLINDNNKAAIQKALKKMQPNSNFYGLSKSALARAICDQRYGYNLTRVYTLLGRKKGLDNVLSVGRVQTPILGLVVARDRANAGHEKQSFFMVEAWLYIEGKRLKGSYQVKDNDNVDDKKRLVNKEQAESIANTVKGKQGVLLSVITEDKQRAAPLPYNLLALQAESSGKWKYAPKKVLEITQGLRDKYKAITYNRSDSRYLNEERHSEAGELLSALAPMFDDAKKADSSLKSKAFNDKKVTAHHAIIPTLSVPDLEKLSEEERNIYMLITRQYIAQFYPPETYRLTTIIFEAENHQFKTTSRVDGDQGWRVLFDNNEGEKDKTERENLEALKEGDKGDINEAVARQEFTRPPALYTMKTLLTDLTRVARYIEDPEIRKLLLDKDSDKQNESGGIGTPATRDTHIDTLFQRAYITESGKYIVSTDLGKQFHNTLPDFAVKPDLTALWHEKQKAIEAGELDYQQLIKEVDQAVEDEITRVKKEGLSIEVKDVEECPACKEGILKRRKGKHGFFWGCNNYPKCKNTAPDKKGKPDFSEKKTAPAASDKHLCPKCDSGLVRRPAKKKGVLWWGCSGFPKCKFTTFDNNGTPKEEKEHK